MKRWSVLRRVALAGSFLASGCALAISTSEYAGGSKTTPGADGGKSGAQLDGAISTLPDGASPSSDGGGTASPFCAALLPKPIFCEDFDEGPFNPADWTTEDTEDVSTLAVDTTRSISAPSSFLTAVTKGKDMFPPAYVRHSIGTVSTIRIEADVYVERTDSAQYGTRILGAQLGGGTTVTGGTLPMFGIFANGTANVTEEWGTSLPSTHLDHGSKGITYDHWLHVIESVDLGAKTLSVTVDGVEYSDGKPIGGPITQGDVSALIGVYYGGVGDEGWAVRFDNLVVDGH